MFLFGLHYIESDKIDTELITWKPVYQEKNHNLLFLLISRNHDTKGGNK